MKIPELLEDLAIISQLGDNPGSDDGLSAEALKAKFDEAALKIQKYINTVLIPAVNPAVIPKDYFAPAGYGYGESQTLFNYESLNELLSALDATLAIMPDRSSKQIAICCNGLVKYYFTFTCTLWKAFDGYATLEGITYDGARIQLLKFDGAWGAVEWKNPPMRPGVEYRTTERWDGSPVYTMLIYCGNMPTAGGTTKTDLPSSINGWVDKVLRANGTDSSGDSIPYSWEGEYRTEVSANRSAIYIYAKDDYSSNRAYVQIWYVRHQEG